jgi:hypothetical protein
MHPCVVAIGLVAGMAAVCNSQARMFIRFFPSSAHC